MLQRQSIIKEIERANAATGYRFEDPLLADELERLAKLAANLCSVPIALINTVEMNTVTVRASVGFSKGSLARGESFCSHTVSAREPLIVTNAKADPRFHVLPLVKQDNGILFYCGIPIFDVNRFAIGSVCVVDFQARFLTDSQVHALKIVANQTGHVLEKFSR